MPDYPDSLTPVGQVVPCPRRIRGVLGTVPVFDTTAARYVWELPYYPAYYVPVDDVDAAALVDEDVVEQRDLGRARRHGLRAGDEQRPGAAWLHEDGELRGLLRIDWPALDAWFEEDEEIFVHPRSPYTRVDALRSNRTVRVELDGVLLAESPSPVLVFETGLPTRHYLPRTDVRFAHLEPSDTVTQCPYKGRTTDYWSVRVGDQVHRDLAWSYDFPTRQLLPVAGLVCFYDEKVDVSIDGQALERPSTHMG